MDEREKLELSFGVRSSQMRRLRTQDPILEELLSDYLVLTGDLDVVVGSSGTDAENYLMAARDSLRALELEIRERISGAT